MNFVPVPGFGAPNLEPETNLGVWLDFSLLEGHLWAQSKTWDPEGILSTIPAIATGIIGMLTGKLFTEIKDPATRVSWMFFIGAILIVLGLGWGLFFPINKSLWTSSFVLYTAGIAMQFLAACHWLIDVHGVKSWSKLFTWYGMNAIFCFCGFRIACQNIGLVMTSANPHGEPLVIGNDEAQARLSGIADAYLLHDREIVGRCDDSVLRRGPAFILRARGYVPVPVALKQGGPTVLAVGGHLKNTICLMKGKEAFLSQHIGGLVNVSAIGFLEETVGHLLAILDVRPERIAHDRHPDFASTHLALRLAGEFGVPALPVAHHHAHIAAICAEHGVNEPLIGLAIDGVGLGVDGGLWGGELLHVDGASCVRLGHLRELRLPGGERAAREPWRMAVSVLHGAGLGACVSDWLGKRSPERDAGPLLAMLERNLRCPPSSSLGRLIDAAAGLLGLRSVVSYEGQAAMLLEGLAQAYGVVPALAGGFVIKDGVLDFAPLLLALYDNVEAAYGAALFHATVAAGLAQWAMLAVDHEKAPKIAVGGGCALNLQLMTALRTALERAGVTMLEARQGHPMTAAWHLATVLRLSAQTFALGGKESQNIAFEYQGSNLSALKDSELPAPLLAFRDALRRVRSLELLSPEKLRKSARVSERDIGAGGEKLSAYLDNIKGEQKIKLVELLKKFYPALVDFKITSQRSGWKKLSVFEQFGSQKLETEALHLNDGLLRILAVLTQADADHSLLLLDELENGINQEILETLVDTLLQSPQQLLVTTHSPLLLNYLPDDVARKAVQFLYTTPQGETRCRSFFSIPRVADKLNAMGPGDAFVDTDLRMLAQECIDWLEKIQPVVARVMLILKIHSAAQTIQDLVEVITENLHQLHTVLESFEVLKTNSVYRCPHGQLPESLHGLRDNLMQHSQVLLDAMELLKDALRRKKLQPQEDDKNPAVDKVLSELSFLCGRVENMTTVWKLFGEKTADGDGPIAKWFTAQLMKNHQIEYGIFAARVRIGALLARRFWQLAAGAILTSATLRSLGNFNLLMTETGLNELPQTNYLALASPFDLPFQSYPPQGGRGYGFNCRPSDEDVK